MPTVACTNLGGGPGTEGAVALTRPQLAWSGQPVRLRAALWSRSTTSPLRAAISG